MNWTPENEAEANKQGWTLGAVWDPVKQRVDCKVFMHGTRFTTDEVACGYVAHLASINDKLAVAATQAVFHSRLGATEQTRKGKKK